MSELSNVLIQNTEVGRKPTDNTMMRGVAEKAASSSRFLERLKNTLGNFFPLTIGTGTGNEVDTQEENEVNRENDESESQVGLSNSTQENEAPANTELGYSDRFVSV